MAAVRQLWLVQPQEQQPTQDPARRVFEHWAFMLGKNPNRCSFGPTRRRAVAAFLELYDEDTLLLACEGIASDPSANGENRLGVPFNDLTHMLASEHSVERYADMGERLRQRALQARAAAPVQALVSVDPAEVLAAKQRLRELATRMRGGR